MSDDLLSRFTATGLRLHEHITEMDRTDQLQRMSVVKYLAAEHFHMTKYRQEFEKQMIRRFVYEVHQQGLVLVSRQPLAYWVETWQHNPYDPKHQPAPEDYSTEVPTVDLSNTEAHAIVRIRLSGIAMPMMIEEV